MRRRVVMKSSRSMRDLFAVWVVCAVLLVSSTVLASPSTAAAQTGIDVRFPFPTQVPFEPGDLVAANGPHNGSGDGHSWAYVDLGFSSPSEVVAMASGTIAAVGTCDDGGREVFVDHPDGWRSHYYHLEMVADFQGSGRELREGDPISLGAPIGTISAGTNCDADSHLQLGIFRDEAGNQSFEPVHIRSMSIGGYTVTSRDYPYGGIWTRDSDGVEIARDRPCDDEPSGCASGAVEVIRPPSPEQADPDLGKVSTVLILDSTGSMAWNDPPVPAAQGADYGLRLQAAVSYVRSSLPGDEIAVVDFDTVAKVVSPVVNVEGYGSPIRTSLAELIRNIDASGSTHLGNGLQSGCDVLKTQASYEQRTAIFFTDGIGDYPVEATECFRDNGWKVFTIGLSNEVDEGLLRWVAESTGGSYRFLDPGGDRLDVCSFLQIRAETLGQSVEPCEAANVITQDQTIEESRLVAEELLQISFIANWPVGDIEMTLTSPSGRVVSRSSNAGDLVVDAGPTYEVLTVNAPEPGEWTIHLFGSDIPGGVQPYSFTTAQIVLPAPEPSPLVLVRAKGSTGDERFEVRVDGVSMGAFHASTSYADYVLSLPHGAAIADLQVAFINDSLGDGYDRNLQVDYVEFNGKRYESEADTTLGTGTYSSSSPCRPGYLGSEHLHCNGYFQYAQPERDGSEVLVRAKGQTGDEMFEVQVNGRVVAGFSVTRNAADYTVALPKTATIADIKVVFINDAVRGSYDRNLLVDYIEYGGQRFESEADTTLGTGTYRNDSRCRPGYMRSESLHCNGYFKYA